MMNLTVEEGFTRNQDTGHRKAAILSAEELFRWRKKEVLPVPQRGGVKDFEPDGSWLQDKRLETFYGEYMGVLTEPRVEKSGNLVKGSWDSEMKLVNIEKTAKFWMKMGFANNDRNWLHPEEALFLMEVNCLEVMHNGVSLSLQEAYSLLLHPSCNISEEEYQVFAHLRRLGYIVLRHAGKLDLTQYEMKIGLHKYSKKKNKKRSANSAAQSQSLATSKPDQDKCLAGSVPGEGHKSNSSVDGECGGGGGASASQKTANGESASTLQCAVLTDSTKCGHSASKHGTSAESNDNIRDNPEHARKAEDRKRGCMECERLSEDYKRDNSAYQRREESTSKDQEKAEVPHTTRSGYKRTNCSQDEISIESTSKKLPKKKAKLDSDSESSRALSQELSCPHSSDPWSEATQQSFTGQRHLLLTEWDFGVIDFPDMGGRDTVSLTIPPPHCLPPNTSMEEEYEDICMFDVEEYRQQQQLSSVIEHEDKSRHLRQMEFSYAEWYKKNFRPISARNWREWKEIYCHRQKSFLCDSPVAHLWQGDVTPLVQPLHALSTDSILRRLSVIQPYQGPFPAKERCEAIKFPLMSTFQIQPSESPSQGSGSQSVYCKRIPPPRCFDVHAPLYLEENFPLHGQWHFGDICFFVFEDIVLPDIYLHLDDEKKRLPGPGFADEDLGGLVPSMRHVMVQGQCGKSKWAAQLKGKVGGVRGCVSGVLLLLLLSQGGPLGLFSKGGKLGEGASPVLIAALGPWR
ncbi:uncharacterized protein LOC143281321 [Babylonia areolata]|uniref:uncharacterized protein LOC143281321 n=1 Tax=Babylonia areolata TaxID=304850 RepID=UPI003FD4288C